MLMSRGMILLLAPLALFLAGCGVGEGTGSTPPWSQPQTPTAPAQLSSVSSEGEADVEVIDPYQVRMETTKGDVVIAVHPEWAPRGAARFKELVEAGYYDDNRVFRVVNDFVVQFGMHGDPVVNAKWDTRRIADDPVLESNQRGFVTFATSGSNARTTQIFINLKDNPSLDGLPQQFAPFGEVIEGMGVVDSFHSGYGGAPSDRQPEIAARGNEFLDAEYPNLDSIIRATIVAPAEGAAEAADDPEIPADEANTDAAPNEQ